MRPRTKSIVNAGEYFRQESAYARGSSSMDNDNDDDWMDIALRGKVGAAESLHHLAHANALITKGRKRGGSVESNFSSRSTQPSWDENDPDFDLTEDDDEDDDEEEDGIARRRRCSHERRISFDDEVSVVSIPARSSFDADYKRRVWYSMEDLSRMRHLD